MSLAAAGEETPAVLWLDGRDDKVQHRYHLMTAAIGATVEQQKMVDDDVCTCCPTALVRTERGLLAAYRDHTADNIEASASYAASMANGRALAVSQDHWRINGCPLIARHSRPMAGG